jgi:hypothetical protein
VLHWNVKVARGLTILTVVTAFVAAVGGWSDGIFW